MVIKVSSNQGFHCLFTTFLILTIFLTLLVNAGSAQSEDSVAYVYMSDKLSLGEYESILSVDFDMDNFSIEKEEHIDFSKYDVIIIGPDLNFDGNIHKNVRDDITKSGKPIAALGPGGASYLNSVYNTDLNFSSTNAVGIYPEGIIILFFNSARPIFTPANTVIPLYKEPGSEWIVADFTTTESIIPFGRSSDGSDLYTLAFERNNEKGGYEYKWFLWGFTGSPYNLTDKGSSLFVNIITEMTRHSSGTIQPSPAPSAPGTPVPNGESKKLTQMIGVILVMSGLLFTALTTLKKDTTIEIGISEKTLKYVGGAGILFVLVGTGLILISSGLVTINTGGLI
jgi:hypothetical protein